MKKLLEFEAYINSDINEGIREIVSGIKDKILSKIDDGIFNTTSKFFEVKYKTALIKDYVIYLLSLDDIDKVKIELTDTEGKDNFLKFIKDRNEKINGYDKDEIY